MEERIGLVAFARMKGKMQVVLILIVMEERIGFVSIIEDKRTNKVVVLILIVMEERIGLALSRTLAEQCYASLNPYCNGRKNRI